MMTTNDDKHVVEQWAETEPIVSILKYTWTINKFSYYKGCEVGAHLKSPTFSFDGDDAIKWSLLFFVINKCTSAICLNLESEIKSNLVGKCTIRILSANANRLIKNTNFSNLKPYQCVDHALGFQPSELFDYPNVYLPEDKLKIFCEIHIVTDNISNSSQKNVGQFKVPECKITDDFGSLLGSHKFSDITLVVGEHEFRAHKAILACRSDVFAAMFEHDMEERKTGRVNITDISREVLQEVLKFIYTGEAPNIKEMANHLLAAADKYGLEKLKVMSEEAIFNELSEENAIDILILADLHSASQLKEQTIRFIKEHRKNILKTDAWQNMKTSNAHLSLITAILEAVI